MSTLEEAEAQQWLIENGHMEDPYQWSSWKPVRQKWYNPKRSTFSGALMFKEAYYRRKRVRKVDINGYSYGWMWKYQWATKKEAFLSKLGNK